MTLRRKPLYRRCQCSSRHSNYRQPVVSYIELGARGDGRVCCTDTKTTNTPQLNRFIGTSGAESSLSEMHLGVCSLRIFGRIASFAARNLSRCVGSSQSM
jgi:hypothetical protein